MQYVLETASCDGTDSSIVSSQTCVIPVTTLTAAPFELNWGDSVYAKVIASNIKGESLESEEGNGAIIITSPSPPINLAEDPTIRSYTTVGLQWDEPYNGGASIFEYRVNMAV